tara:strand:- start:2408 stop:2692 length:285 start_codon:yes stop_codon:yes gene_type:complete
MRWNNIPISKVNKIHESKILGKLQKVDPTIKWYGYSVKEWVDAFKAKNTAEEECYNNNIVATEQLAQLRRRKEYENNRIAFKLLINICKAASLD